MISVILAVVLIVVLVLVVDLVVPPEVLVISDEMVVKEFIIPDHRYV